MNDRSSGSLPMPDKLSRAWEMYDLIFTKMESNLKRRGCVFGRSGDNFDKNPIFFFNPEHRHLFIGRSDTLGGDAESYNIPLRTGKFCAIRYLDQLPKDRGVVVARREKKVFEFRLPVVP
jgi:hypothetical protein